jgi:hypothetical protein
MSSHVDKRIVAFGKCSLIFSQEVAVTLGVMGPWITKVISEERMDIRFDFGRYYSKP